MPIGHMPCGARGREDEDNGSTGDVPGAGEEVQRGRGRAGGVDEGTHERVKALRAGEGVREERRALRAGVERTAGGVTL